MTMPVYSLGDHEGMLSLDVSYENLLNTHGKLAGSLGILNTSMLSLPESAMRVLPLNIESVAGTHVLYYMFDLPGEIGNFFYFERYSLLVVAIVYIFSVIVLFFINTRVEHSYFKELAAKDSMTGLLIDGDYKLFLRILIIINMWRLLC
jgi:hypothetical protein